MRPPLAIVRVNGDHAAVVSANIDPSCGRDVPGELLLAEIVAGCGAPSKVNGRRGETGRRSALSALNGAEGGWLRHDSEQA